MYMYMYVHVCICIQYTMLHNTSYCRIAHCNAVQYSRCVRRLGCGFGTGQW